MNKLEEVKKKTQSELTKKVQGEKVNLIREALKNDNIEISADCVDVSSLKRELKDKLPEISYDNTLIKIDGISKSLDELLENLENSSSNSAGIGLSLAKKIILMDNGKISVESKKNEYTIFKIKYYN